MSISLVGSLVKGTGTAKKTLAVSPTATGDVLVFFFQSVASDATSSAVSGGGVTKWNKAAYSNVSAAGDVEVWWGVITSTGAATITITVAAAGTTNLGALQFTAGAGHYWYKDGSGGGTTVTTQAASGNYPSLTPVGSGDLYVGTAYLAGGTVGGSTSGYTYLGGSAGFEANAQIIYNPACTSAAQSPAWTQASGYYSAAGALLLANTTPYPSASAGLLPLLEMY